MWGLVVRVMALGSGLAIWRVSQNLPMPSPTRSHIAVKSQALNPQPKPYRVYIGVILG